MKLLGTGHYPFTDPLAAVRSADDGSPSERMQKFITLITVIGVVTMLIGLLLPDSDTSDRPVVIGLICTLTVAAVVMILVAPLPDLVLLATPAGASLVVSVLVGWTEPMAVAPVFYLWPVIIAAYFFQMREQIATYVFVNISFAAALTFSEPGVRMIIWLAIVAISGSLVVAISLVKVTIVTLLGRLDTLATRDSLTGVLNRRAFMARLDEEVERGARFGETCSLAVLDLDYFKQVNDRFGHPAGDTALRRIAAAIEGHLRHGDAVARLGGEEFAVLLVGTGEEAAADHAEDLRHQIAADGGGPCAITVSIGVAEIGPDHDIMQMLHDADHALYFAKDNGRNQVMRASHSHALPARVG